MQTHDTGLYATPEIGVRVDPTQAIHFSEWSKREAALRKFLRALRRVKGQRGAVAHLKTTLASIDRELDMLWSTPHELPLPATVITTSRRLRKLRNSAKATLENCENSLRKAEIALRKARQDYCKSDNAFRHAVKTLAGVAEEWFDSAKVRIVDQESGMANVIFGSPNNLGHCVVHPNGFIYHKRKSQSILPQPLES